MQFYNECNNYFLHNYVYTTRATLTEKGLLLHIIVQAPDVCFRNNTDLNTHMAPIIYRAVLILRNIGQCLC